MTDCYEVSGREWDARLSTFRDGLHEQSFAYAAARWGESRVCCVTVERNGVKLGGALAVVAQVPVMARGFAAIKFGPLYRGGSGGEKDDARAVTAAIKSFFCDRRKLHLSIIPQAPIEDGVLLDALAKEGFREGVMLADPTRYFVDLSYSEEELRSGLAQQWRRKLKLAEKQELRVDELTGEAGLPVFGKLFNALKERKQAVDATGLKEMAALANSPHEELRPRVFLAARSGADALAGAVVTTVGERAVFAFGAQSAEGAAISASYALQWAIVDRLRRERRWRWYDLGGDNNSQGLVQFKSGFIGKTGRIAKIPARREYSQSRVSRLMARAAFELKGR